MKYVTIYTAEGGVSLGKIDEKGRLVWRSGVRVLVSQPDVRDRILRKGVVRIVKDDGKKYKQIVNELCLPSSYIPPEKKCST